MSGTVGRETARTYSVKVGGGTGKVKMPWPSHCTDRPIARSWDGPGYGAAASDISPIMETSGMITVIGVVCITAAFGAAASQVAGRGGLHIAAKMTAASAYLAFALMLGAAGSLYGRLVLIALALSWIGDLALVGRGTRSFLVGLGSFLAAHVAYSVAFSVRGVTTGPVLLGAAVMALVAVAVLRWLDRARLPATLRLPVMLYLAAIGVMVALAAGTAWVPPGPVGAYPPPAPGVLAGAILFAGSDVLVARERFVRSDPVNRLVGLPLYFAAQLLLAASVA